VEALVQIFWPTDASTSGIEVELLEANVLRDGETEVGQRLAQRHVEGLALHSGAGSACPSLMTLIPHGRERLLLVGLEIAASHKVVLDPCPGYARADSKHEPFVVALERAGLSATIGVERGRQLRAAGDEQWP